MMDRTWCRLPCRGCCRCKHNAGQHRARSGAAAEHYADIRVKLEAAGTPIGSMDLIIAAHACSIGAVVVTNNEKHFRRVVGLTVENWA